MTSKEQNLKSQTYSLQGIPATFIFYYSLEVNLAFLISMFSGTMVTFRAGSMGEQIGNCLTPTVKKGP